MSKLLVLQGLPGSGKSTFAKQLLAGDIHDMKGVWKRVNKDELRAMLDNSHWSKANEKFVLEVRDFVIQTSMEDDYNIIVDDTNLDPKHIEHFNAMVEEYNEHKRIKELQNKYKLEVKFFDTPLDECIQQDFNRANGVGKKVIMQMYNRYLKEVKTPTVYSPPADGEPAIMVDIDGTLAHNLGGRDIYDYSRVHEDHCDPVISELVRAYNKKDYTIIVCSGREDDSRELTEEWLKNNHIPFDLLFMRKVGDHRKDSIIKREIFEEHIKDKYNVHFVLDDRNQVVDMWRNELGLKVLQVAEGDF